MPLKTSITEKDFSISFSPKKLSKCVWPVKTFSKFGCHMLFMQAFTVIDCIFEVISLVKTKYKRIRLQKYIVENTCLNILMALN